MRDLWEGSAAHGLLKNEGWGEWEKQRRRARRPPGERWLSNGSHTEGQGRLRGRIFGVNSSLRGPLGTALTTTSSPDLSWAHCAGKNPGAERGMPLPSWQGNFSRWLMRQMKEVPALSFLTDILEFCHKIPYTTDEKWNITAKRWQRCNMPLAGVKHD